MALTSNIQSPITGTNTVVRHRAAAPTARIHLWLAWVTAAAGWLLEFARWAAAPREVTFTRRHVAVFAAAFLILFVAAVGQAVTR